MADIVIASALLACTYFFVSMNARLNDYWAKMFFYLGFLMVPVTFGLSLTAEADVIQSVTIMIHVILFVVLVFADLTSKAAGMWRSAYGVK